MRGFVAFFRRPAIPPVVAFTLALCLLSLLLTSSQQQLHTGRRRLVQASRSSNHDGRFINSPAVASSSPPPRQRSLSSLSHTIRDATLTLWTRIVGGQPARHLQYPSYAWSAGPRLCGATLIHADVLLSAAHCHGVFVDGGGAFIGGIIIEGSTDKNSRWVEVESELLHPDFDNVTIANDIMLVKLKERIDDIPLQLLSFQNNNKLEDGTKVTAIGFGYTSENGTTASTLQTVDLALVNFDTCNAYYEGRLHKDVMLCASTKNGKDSCSGDSGGPLLLKTDDDNEAGTIQIGIISFGSGCARSDTAGAVYARIDAYTDWIQDGICTLSASPPSSCPTNAGSTAATNGNGGLGPSKAPKKATAAGTVATITTAPSPAPVDAMPDGGGATAEPTVFSFESITASPTVSPTASPITRQPVVVSTPPPPPTSPPRPTNPQASPPTKPTSKLVTDWLHNAHSVPNVPTASKKQAKSPPKRPTSTNLLQWINQRRRRPNQMKHNRPHF